MSTSICNLKELEVHSYHSVGSNCCRLVSTDIPTFVVVFCR